MKKLITLMLAVSLLFSLMMPQAAFAGESTETSTETTDSYPFDLHVLPLHTEMESETSIRIFWLQDMVPYKALQITLRKADDASNQTQSVRIDAPTAEELKKQSGNLPFSHVLENLSPNTSYVITMQGILTGADGQEVFTKPWNIEGSTYVQTPQYVTCWNSKNRIYTYWDCRERNAVLKLYRSDTLNGSYELVHTFGAMDKLDEGDEGPSRQYCRFSLNDPYDHSFDSEAANKTFYYKAQAEITKNSKTYRSAMSEPVAQKTKNSIGQYTVKRLKSNSTKQLKLKLTSDTANYNTYLKKFESLEYKRDKRAVKKVEYSRDGKKYYALKNKKVLLKPGESLYLRITTKKPYPVKNYIKHGHISLNVKYNAETSRALHLSSRSGYLDSRVEEKKISVLTKFSPNDAAPTAFNSACKVRSFFSDARMKGSVQKDGTFLISWMPTNKTESYAVRFGTTKSSVMYDGAAPLIIPKNQVQTAFKNLDKNKTYYFSVIPCENADGTGAYDGDHFYLKWNGKKFTELLQSN